MKILVVEDDADSRAFLEAALEGRGYAVESAPNGARALELARDGTPDLIVSDILMPEMDGFALCRAVKADEGLRRVPFVFYTATYVDPRDEQLALALGASRFLVKPMEPVEFLRVIDDVLKDHRERALPVPERPSWPADQLEEMHSARLAAKLDQKIRDLERERRALGETEAWLRSVLRAAPGAILCFSPEGRAVDLNAEAERMLGVEGREALEQGGASLLFSDPAAGDAFQRVLGGEPIRGWEARLVGPAGQERILVWNLERIAAPADGPVGVVAVGRDLTEERRAEQARRRSEERLELALRGADLGLWDWDLRTGEVTHNDRWCEMLGRDGDEGGDGCETWEGRVHPDERPRVLAAMEAHLAGRAPLYEMEHRLQTRSGEWKWVLARARVVEWDEEGKPARVAGTHLDITERKRMEGEREALEEQLSKVQHLESIGRLAGGIAHDFNNLLTPIVACAEMIAMRPEAASLVAERARQILGAADRAGDLTRQFLAFSRRQVLEMRRLDLNEVVVGFHKLLRQLVREDIEIALRLSPSLGRVLADRSQIEQVIMNLAINAADAMPRGGTLAIATSNTVVEEAYAAAHADARPGPHAVLSVSDTGCGMNREVLEHIFEPLFTTKEKGKGTGLGLSTVYGVVKQHGGYVGVESDVGSGTTFRIYLPEVEGEEEAATAAPTRPDATGGTETVLVVEDQEMVRSLAREVLTERGYRVLDAAHARDALAIAENHGGPIHLLLSDVILPGMNGVDLARQLSAARPGLKLLFMSGYADEVLSPHGVMGPGTHFLQKPFTVQDLTRKVREVLDRPDTGADGP